MRRLPSIVMFAAALGGCASLPHRSFTGAEANAARIPGISDARIWADDASGFSAIRPRAAAENPVTLLALSGGSDNGAYGAGFVTGWTRSGHRPNFTIVTGVSTGALLAPFVFLGPQYDPQITAAYTRIGPRDVYRIKFPLTALLSTGLANTKPLQRLLARFVTDQVVDEVAAQHRLGRRLLVGTANLDAQRGVVWNMGAIAASDAPNRYAVFRRVLLASAAVPALFPPVLIDARAGSHQIKEVHVDGATVGSILAVPPGVVAQSQGLRQPDALYLIVNGPIEGRFALVTGGVVEVASRAFALNLSSAVREQADTAWLWSRANGATFHLTYVPADFDGDRKHVPFDTAFMNRLFRFGQTRGQQAAWFASPPIAVARK